MLRIHEDHGAIVIEALVRMKSELVRERAETLSLQPRNGKLAATTDDAANEELFARRLQEIDTILRSLAMPSGLSPTQSPDDLNSANVRFEDDKPYINPFDGKTIVPVTADTPGSSVAVMRVRHSLPPPLVSATIFEGIGSGGGRGATVISPVGDQSASLAGGDAGTELANKEQVYNFEDPQGMDRMLEEFERYFDSQERNLQLDAMLAFEVTNSDAHQRRQIVESEQTTRSMAEDVPQDLEAFLEAQERHFLEENQQVRATEQAIYDQDLKQFRADQDYARTVQSEWNQAEDTVLLNLSSMAQMIADQEAQKEIAEELKELRRLQELLQAEDDRALEADRKLAWELSEEKPRVLPTPISQTRLSHINPSASSAYRGMRQPPHASNLQSSEAEPALIRSPKLTHDASEPDGKVLKMTIEGDQSMAVAQDLQSEWERQWQAQMEQNTSLARKAQEEIHNLEVQAQRDMQMAQQLRDRDRQEQERQAQEQEERNATERLKKQLRQEDADRQRQAQEAARLAQMEECTACRESLDRNAMCELGCEHYLCRDCVVRSIDSALKSRSAFSCCGRRTDSDVLAPFLPSKTAVKYAALMQELDTPNPVYCSKSRCSAFIPPSQHEGDLAICSKCSTRTCRLCKAAMHQGVCKADTAGQQLLALGDQRQWKQCPHCGTMVERVDGCLHMSCGCGRDFCYSCGKKYSSCKGTCPRR